VHGMLTFSFMKMKILFQAELCSVPVLARFFCSSLKVTMCTVHGIIKTSIIDVICLSTLLDLAVSR